MKVFQIRQDDRFAWYETSKEHMEDMVNKCNWQGRVLELAKDDSAQPVQQPAPVAADERAAFESLCRNNAGAAAPLQRSESGAYCNYGIQAQWVGWEARSAIAQRAAPVAAPTKDQEILALHRKLAAETLRADQGWQRYEEANRDRNSLRAGMGKDVPAASVQPFVPAGYANETEFLRQQLKDSRTANKAAQLVIAELQAGKPDSGRDAALADPDRVPYLIVYDDVNQTPEPVIGGTRAAYRFSQISTSWNAHLYVKIASNSRDEKYPSAALAAHPANVAQPLKPMGEDGNEWYFDCDGHYIDVKRDESGKYSVYFRNQKDGSEAYSDQADANVAQLSELASTQRQVIELQSQLNAVLLERGESANVALVGELSDAQIGDIADNYKFKDHYRSNAEAVKFARAILAAAKKGDAA